MERHKASKTVKTAKERIQEIDKKVNLSLIAENFPEVSIEEIKPSQPAILEQIGKKSLIKIKSQSAIFSKQSEVRFIDGVFPGQTVDLKLLDSPAPNEYNQIVHKNEFMKRSANFLSTYRRTNVFEQLKERDRKINLAPGQYA